MSLPVVNCPHFTARSATVGNCAHPDKPHGDRPSLGVCRHSCRFGPREPWPIPEEYDGQYQRDSKGSEGCNCA